MVFETIKKKDLLGDDLHYMKALEKNKPSHTKLSVHGDDDEDEFEDVDDEDDAEIIDLKSAITANWARGGGSRKTVLRAASKFKGLLNKDAKGIMGMRGHRPSMKAAIARSRVRDEKDGNDNTLVMDLDS